MCLSCVCFNINAGEDDEDDCEVLIDPGGNNNRTRIVVERNVFTQTRFDEQFRPGRRPSRTVYQRAARKLSKYICSCSEKCCKVFLFGVFPFLTIMKDYNIRQDLPGDVIAGLTVGIMHIPQGTFTDEITLEYFTCQFTIFNLNTQTRLNLKDTKEKQQPRNTALPKICENTQEMPRLQIPAFSR